MAEGHVFHGVVVPGRGRAASFIGDQAVIERMAALLGMTPVPGTLNVRLHEPWSFPASPRYFTAAEIASDWEERTGQAGYHWWRTVIGRRYRGVVARPDEPGYPVDLVELVGEVHLRTELGLHDGDPIEFAVVS